MCFTALKVTLMCSTYILMYSPALLIYFNAMHCTAIVIYCTALQNYSNELHSYIDVFQYTTKLPWGSIKRNKHPGWSTADMKNVKN